MGRLCLRPEGWESRLEAVIQKARSQDFDARDWNCCRFAAECAAAILEKPMPRRLHGSIQNTVDALFPRTTWRLAKRGDVVLMNVPESSLGVCAGRVALFVGVSGLVHFPMRLTRIAWSV